ncbi:MAG: bifunctional nuclease family protein [Planctomycetota bacterium]
MPIRMSLSRILMCDSSDAHIVELREEDGERVFPITIGRTEVLAIERRLMGHEPPRPQTHELFAATLDALGYELDKILINDLRDHTFFARLHLRPQGGGEIIDIDSRPSDAIALGVATEAPIYVSEAVLDEVWNAE